LKVEEKDQCPSKVIFLDEAAFYISEILNRHNC